MEQSPQETKFLQLFFFFFLVELMFFFPQTVSLEKESTKKNLQMYSAGGSLSVCSEIFLFLSGCLTEGKKLDAYFVVIRIQSHSIPNKIRWQQNLLHTRHYHSPSVAFSSDTTCAWRTECNQTEGEKRHPSAHKKATLFSCRWTCCHSLWSHAQKTTAILERRSGSRKIIQRPRWLCGTEGQQI